MIEVLQLTKNYLEPLHPLQLPLMGVVYMNKLLGHFLRDQMQGTLHGAAQERANLNSQRVVFRRYVIVMHLYVENLAFICSAFLYFI